MVEHNTNGDAPRLVLTPAGARVVLAEADAPGSLHYLLEAEGFHVIGCAADERELGRVLGQGLEPDVVVLDADIVATSSLVARELAPDAHVIAVWPDDVQAPPGGERVSPRAVYEELGPAIRRHMDRRTVAVPVVAMPSAEPAIAAAAAVATGGPLGRAASRVSVLSVTLLTAILLTMGVAFALGGFRSIPPLGPPRVVVPGSPDAGTGGSSDALTGRVPPPTGGGHPDGSPGGRPRAHGDHHNGTRGVGAFVVTTSGGGGGGGDGSTSTDQGGDTSTDQGGGSGDQGGTGGGGGQGGGGQGGGGQGGGGQGGGGGGQGGQGDHGSQGHHGGGSGHGEGDGDGDQGGDGQGDGNDQGENEQGDQGGNSGGGHGSRSDRGRSGDGHGAHTTNRDK